MRLGSERLEPARRGQPGDPAAVRRRRSRGRAAPSERRRALPHELREAPMNAGSSFSAGGRSSRTPRPAATAAAFRSMSKRTRRDRRRSRPAPIRRPARPGRRAPPGARRGPGPPTARASGPADWYAHDQRSSGSPARLATRLAVSRHCAPYGSPDASTRSREAVRAEDDVDARRARPPASARARPRRAPRTPPRGPGRRGSSERARRDAPAVELEAVGHLLLVAGDRQRAEVRREHEAHGVRHALLRHLSDDLLDPGRPVAHAEVAAEVVAELGLERVDLPLVTSRRGERPPIAR